MPSLDTGKLKNGRISIGFGLDGYLLKPKEAPQPSQIVLSFGGGGGVELDGNYVKDDKLKQEYTDIGTYLSFPIEYMENGEKKVAIYKSGTSSNETGYTIGELAYGGATCPLLGAGIAGGGDSANSGIGQRLAAAETKLSEYKPSTSSDFLVGCAVNANTILNYFKHFYPDKEIKIADVNKLCSNGLMCAEILFNFGGGKGRVQRIKVIDSCKEEGKILVMSVVFMTQGLKSYCPLSGTYIEKGYSDARNDGFDFAFSGKKYNWQSGTIPGYNPSYIKSIADSIKFPFNATGNLLQFGNQAQSATTKCRVRYFVDLNKKGEAQSICPSIPDEFFNTNYSDGESVTYEDITSTFDPSAYSDAGSAIYAAAQRISQFVNCYGSFSSFVGKHKFIYKAKGNVCNGAAPTTPTEKWPLNWKPNGPGQGFYDLCCGSFVFWALGESGVTRKSPISCPTTMEFCNRQHIQNVLAPGYEAIDLGTNPAVGQRGDVLIYGKGGASHGGIFDSFNGVTITEFGGGCGTGFSNNGTKKDTNQPSWRPNHLTHIIRIAKKNTTQTPTQTPTA